MTEPTYIITSPGVKRRYEKALERLAGERARAAQDWYDLRWWQWRKRRRLERVLFGLGGWRVPLDLHDIYAPYVPLRIR